MMKILKTILIYFFLIIILSVTGLVYFIGMTTSGLQLAIGLASKSLPGILQIQHMEGKLLSEFTLQNISYVDSQQKASIQTLYLSWNPIHLLRKKIVINNLFLNHIQVNFQEKIDSPRNSSHFPSVYWLSNVILKRAQIQDVLVSGTVQGFPIKSTANVVFEKGQLEIYNTQFSIANSIMTLTGTMKDTWNIQWQIHIPKLDTLIPNTHGAFESSGTIKGPPLTPQIEMKLEGNHLAFKQQLIQKISGKILLNLKTQNEFSANLNLQQLKIYGHILDKLQITMTGILLKNKLFTNLKLLVNNNHNQLLGNITLPKFDNIFNLSQPIESKLSLQFNELKSLIPPTPYGKHFKGILTGKAQIMGTLIHPVFSGNLALQQGHIKITKLGIKLNQINLNASYDNHNQIKLNGQLQSGEGTATIQGYFNLHQPSLIMSIQGKNLQIANSSEYKVKLSPDLILTLKENDLHLHGRISVPYAEINATQFGNTVTLPSDVIIVGQEQKKSIFPFNFSMQVHLKLGEEVHLIYDELKTSLDGNLRITQNIGSIPMATGELSTLKGTYRTYGRTLNIQKGGRLIYTSSPLNNPGLDIRAIKQIKKTSITMGAEQITAGVQLLGTANRPIVTLFSSPAGLSQGDILSYIIFGYPQSQVSGSKSLALLSTAASTLSMGGTHIDKLQKKVEKILGHIDIDTESVETFNSQNNSVDSTTTLGIGKQLSPHLYLHYSVGNGVDLMYGFEYD